MRQFFGNIFDRIKFEFTFVNWTSSILYGLAFSGIISVLFILKTIGRVLFLAFLLLLFANRAQAIVNGNVCPDAPVTHIYVVEEATRTGAKIASSSACPISDRLAISCAHAMPPQLREGEIGEIFVPWLEVGRILTGPVAPTYQIGDVAVVKLQIKLLSIGVAGTSTDIAIFQLVGEENRFKMFNTLSSETPADFRGIFTGFGLFKSIGVTQSGALTSGAGQTVSQTPRAGVVALHTVRGLIISISPTDPVSHLVKKDEVSSQKGDSGGGALFQTSEGRLVLTGIISAGVSRPADPEKGLPEAIISIAVDLHSDALVPIWRRAIQNGLDAKVVSPMLP